MNQWKVPGLTEYLKQERIPKNKGHSDSSEDDLISLERKEGYHQRSDFTNRKNSAKQNRKVYGKIQNMSNHKVNQDSDMDSEQDQTGGWKKSDDVRVQQSHRNEQRFSKSSVKMDRRSSNQDREIHEQNLQGSQRDVRSPLAYRQADRMSEVNIHYIQQEPQDFSFKLDTLTVNSAVMFLEKYNQMIKTYEKVPHITRFLSLAVQEELIANARQRRKDVTFLLYTGLQNLTDKKILSMIHYTVRDNYVTDPAQFAKHLRDIKFPKLPDGYKPSPSNFGVLNTLIARYQLRFVTRWKFLTEKTSQRFHMPLERQGHISGMIEAFVEKIPFQIGKRILDQIPRDVIRDCHGSFEEFLRAYFEAVADFLSDSRKTQRLSDVIYGERVHDYEKDYKRKQEVKKLTSDQGVWSSDDEEVSEVLALVELQKVKEQGFKTRMSQNEILHNEDNSKRFQDSKKNNKEIEKSPGGCIRLIQDGVCKLGGLCKYSHEPEEKMRDTWKFYVRKLLGSNYRVTKEQLMEMYPLQKTDLKLLSSTEDTSINRVIDNTNDIREIDSYDEALSEDSNFLHALLAASFPKLSYAERVHKDGLLLAEDSMIIELKKVLFDSGAQHASYISKELVDEHREALSHLIQRVNGEVRLGDNVTKVNFSEMLYAKISFKNNKGEDLSATIKMVVWQMPGLDMILGLPHIIRHYLDLFIEMMQCHEVSRLTAGDDLVNPWTQELDNTIPEEEDTELPSSFSGPLHFLNMNREEAIEEYKSQILEHVDRDFAKNSNVEEYLISEKALAVFVPEKWEGINGVAELELDFKPTLPENLRPRARPVNPRLYEHAKKEFDRLKGYFYTESNSPIASPLVIAPKATKPFIRFCGDYVEVNKHVHIGHYPIPKVIYALEKAAGFSMFLDIDMTNSFHQIPLAEKTSNILSVQTPWGLVRPKFLPEGVGPASGVLQRTVMDVFVDFQSFMITIFDNLLVLCHNYKDAEEKLIKVIDRAYERGMVLKFAKSWIGFKTVTFFGYIISNGKYELSQERKESIQIMPMPINQKQMQRFLGAVLFFKSFIPTFSNLTSPLYAMTKNGFDWHAKTWTEDYLAYFQKLKDCLQEATAIHFPDYELNWIMRVDASDIAVGVVLLQELINEDGSSVLQPIGFASQKFTAQAWKWDPFKKEAYAIYFGVKHFAYYLHGKSIVLETDHRNLIWIEKSLVPIVIRWRVFLQSFQIWLKNIPGKANVVAD
jgi:hypothetical protein